MYMGHLGKIQFSFLFPSLSLDYFDVQDLKIFLDIISFEIIVATLRLKIIFLPDARPFIKTLNFGSVNALTEIEDSFVK